MSFRVAQKTLESLEWPQVVARLRECCRTPQAHEQLARLGNESLDGGEASSGPPEFESSLAGVRSRLAETSEARALLDVDDSPPLGGAHDLRNAMALAGKRGTLTPQELLDIGATLAVLDDTRRFLRAHHEVAPRLADRGEALEDWGDLRRNIDSCIDRSGEVSDHASPALAAARRDANRLTTELQRRLARLVQDPGVRSHLSDDYYTVRGDRFVLPVRADARSRVKGIVHDASRSGTTIFIEPQAVVELNNQLKQAELAIVREVERVLRELTEHIVARLHPLAGSLDTLCAVDLAFARGELSQIMDAVEPHVGEDGVFELRGLRHPLITPQDCVANDLFLGDEYSVLVISGPNGGGKTVAMKAAALAALFIRAGLHVAADPGARADWVDSILADIGDGQDIRENLSTFSAHMANLAAIVKSATHRTLVVLDEVGVGTDPGEGSALAQATLETLADSGARVIATTHYNLLKEMAAVDPRFRNASVDFDPSTLAPTYRLRMGTPGSSSAAAVAARMGMPRRVLERAGALLEREDRQLDRMLSELGASRATLELEQRAASERRAEGEAVRDEYRSKLERLQERRDELFSQMRGDLDRAFRDAHAQVAAVIRDLQRGVVSGSAQHAADARTRLQELAAKTREAEVQAGLGSAPAADELEHQNEVDWPRAKPGDRMRISGGATAVLESLPDAKGRVRVRAGSATLVVDADLLRAEEGPAPSPRAPATPIPSRAGGTHHCHLRGLRVEEALDQLTDSLDDAAAEGRDAVLVIHGVGTGALCRAVREHLRSSPYVSEIRSAERSQGGEGATLALLGRKSPAR